MVSSFTVRVQSNSLQLYLRRAHGCYILDIVYKASMSGVARVQEAMNKYESRLENKTHYSYPNDSP